MTALPDRLTRLARALAVATTRPPVASASVPLQLRNPLNGSGGTTKGARYAANERRQDERKKGRQLGLRLNNALNQAAVTDARCVVLTRVSPKPFDDDNLGAALKSVRDGMAEAWGINDADPRVTWVADWRKGKTHVVEAALWVVPEVTTLGEMAGWKSSVASGAQTTTLVVPTMPPPVVTRNGQPIDVTPTITCGPRFVQDFDASDYERPKPFRWDNALVERLGENEPGIVAAGGKRREVRVTPNVVRAKGGA